MAHVCFRRRKRVHPRFCSEDRTQRLTRRNTGVSDGGWYHYPRSVPHVSETLRGRGIRTAYFAALGSWPGGALEERISASLSRRLSAFFESTPGQDPKAAKYAVLIPGPGMFVNVRNAPRVVIPPPSETPLFRRVCPCVRSFAERRVCTRFHL